MTPRESVPTPPEAARRVPLPSWMRGYTRDEFTGDVIAGVVVAIMLVPQGMAYALLAGLPPQVGLYASILPLMLYGLMGSSRTLAVGPVAIVSLLVVSGIGGLAEPGSAEYIQLVITLAVLVGLIQLVMGVVRLGALVNFLSHSVIAGFTSAAAIVIGFSQLKHLLGFSVPGGEFLEQVRYTIGHLARTNPVELALGALGILVLMIFRSRLGVLLRRLRVPEGWIVPLTKAGPLVIVALGALLVWGLALNERAGVMVVGHVPAGLPPLTLPTLDLTLWQRLLPTALVISLVGTMESISVAKALAAKRRQKIGANQELVALGAANLGATFTGGYPVTGGFSRTVVNFAAGAQTGMASIITALLIALTVLFLTPLFYFLPQAMLAAIILVAVAGLIDIKSLRETWRYDRADALALLVTFVAVLLIGVEKGILAGVAATIALHLWRTSRPHVAIVGRVGQSEIYRNVRRHDVVTWPSVCLIRVDESLFFANAKFLEDTLLGAVADNPALEHLVLIGTAINFIDASALETLEQLHEELRDAGVTLHLAAIKGPVMDRLRAVGFAERVGAASIHLSAHDAMIALGQVPPQPERAGNGADVMRAYAPVKHGNDHSPSLTQSLHFP